MGRPTGRPTRSSTSRPRYAHRWFGLGADPPDPRHGHRGRRRGAPGHRPSPPRGSGPVEVIDRLAAAVEPGLMANASGRFYGWVMGSALPAGAGRRLAGRGLGPERRDARRDAGRRRGRGGRRARGCSSCSGCRRMRPSASRPARRWPTSPASPRPAAGCSPTSAGTSTPTGSPAPRGCASSSGPRATGRSTSRCATWGWGGRRRSPSTPRAGWTPTPCGTPLAGADGPAIVCLQAGNIHSGAFDPFRDAVRGRARRRRLGARRRRVRPLGRGLAAARRRSPTAWPDADSWATDAHKTLNTPYDCGIADRGRRRACPAGDGRARQLPADRGVERWTRSSSVPEMSRRARGVPVWAALASPRRRRGPRPRRRASSRPPAGIADGIARDPGCARAQRRRLHPGQRGVRVRRAHPGGASPAARGGHGDAVGQRVARSRGDPVLGELLADRAGRGARDGRAVARAGGRTGGRARPPWGRGHDDRTDPRLPRPPTRARSAAAARAVRRRQRLAGADRRADAADRAGDLEHHRRRPGREADHLDVGRGAPRCRRRSTAATSTASRPGRSSTRTSPGSASTPCSRRPARPPRRTSSWRRRRPATRPTCRSSTSPAARPGSCGSSTASRCRSSTAAPCGCSCRTSTSGRARSGSAS